MNQLPDINNELAKFLNSYTTEITHDKLMKIETTSDGRRYVRVVDKGICTYLGKLFQMKKYDLNEALNICYQNKDLLNIYSAKILQTKIQHYNDKSIADKRDRVPIDQSIQNVFRNFSVVPTQYAPCIGAGLSQYDFPVHFLEIDAHTDSEGKMQGSPPALLEDAAQKTDLREDSDDTKSTIHAEEWTSNPQRSYSISMVSYIDSLPNEILEAILSYLPFDSSEFACAVNVSKKWNCIFKGTDHWSTQPKPESLFIKNKKWMESSYINKILKIEPESTDMPIGISPAIIERLCGVMGKSSKKLFLIISNSKYQYRSGSMYNSSPQIELLDGCFNVSFTNHNQQMCISFCGLDETTQIPILMLKLAFYRKELMPAKQQRFNLNGKMLGDFDLIPNNANLIFSIIMA